MHRAAITLMAVGLTIACVGETPTDAETLVPDLAVAGNSGCATVAFNVAVTLTGPGTFAGSVTGDLQGTTSVQFIGDTRVTGATGANGGIQHWDITGGVLGALVFDTEFDNRNIDTDRPGSPSGVFENVGTHRATGGVAKANLTYIGAFPLATLTTDHDYHGVICP